MQENISVFLSRKDLECYAVGMLKTGRPSKHDRTPFGERLFHARQRMGLTQAELAEKLGIVQQVVADWERYPCSLKPDQLKRLAEALETSTDFLLGISLSHRLKGPSGKMRQVFVAASQLPRRQQEKVLAVLEPFVTQHAREA